MARKHLRKDAKKRAPKNQPICGLWAVARCIGRNLHTASDVEKFRQECFARNLITKTRSWIGGTTHTDRESVLKGFGWQTVSFGPEHPVPRLGGTVKRLLTDPQFFKSCDQFLLTVCGHCMYVKTNQTKRKLYCMDQRGVQLRLPIKGKSDARMDKLLRQRVLTIDRVQPIMHCA